MADLVDQFGRPIRTKTLAVEQASPLLGIREIWHDTQATGLTPTKLARIFAQLLEGQTDEFITLAEEMEQREPHYASVLATRKHALAGRSPSVEAASDSKADIEMADAVRALIREPEFDDLVDEALDALAKGFSCCEILWETSEKQWKPGAYRWTDPRWFLFLPRTGELRLKNQEGFKGEALQPYKWIVHYPRLKPGFAVSSGLARLAAVAFMCKNYALKDWMRFIETYGMPLRVGRYETTATPDDRAILRRAVASIGVDAAAILPKGMEIEFKDSGANTAGLALYRGTAEWLDQQISKAILGQTASSEGTPGKLGGDQEQASVRRDILYKDARTLAATLNRQLVKPFIDLNYGPQAAYPRIQWVLTEPEDLSSLADFLSKMVPLGLRVQASEIRDRAGLADPDQNAELLGVQAEGATSGSPVRAQRAENRAENRAQNSAQEELDELEAQGLDDWQPVMEPMRDALEKLLDECADADEFKARLPELNFSTEKLADSLALACFKAHAIGEKA